jgi:hypothetical protein
MTTSFISTVPPTDRSSGPPTQRLSRRLDAEWQHLRTSRRMIRRARAWALADPAHPLAAVAVDIDDLDDLLRATQRGAAADNEILLRLVELACTDELAGRVVIQRLLPGLVRQALPYRCFHDDVDPVALAVSAAWLALRSYDTGRRRHHVAASLLSDAIFDAFRRPLRRRSARELVRSPDLFVDMVYVEQPSGLEELAEVVREARAAGVADRDVQLIRELARADSPSLVASQRQVTTRTIRNHRERAVSSVRSAIAA